MPSRQTCRAQASSLLRCAINHGRLSVLLPSLSPSRSGADVHMRDRWGRNALQDAIDNKHPAVAARLAALVNARTTAWLRATST
jgi:hypothetical protein